MAVDVAGASAWARQLLSEAREHKRAAGQHRRAARAKMDEFHHFKARLESMGIKVVVEETATTPVPTSTEVPTETRRS